MRLDLALKSASDVNDTRAERSGRILSSASSNATLTRTVAFCRSAAGTICRRWPWYVLSGTASSEISAGWFGARRDRFDSLTSAPT